MMPEPLPIRPGAIIEWRCATFPNNVHRWQVNGVHLGGLGVESLIEMESMTHKPGWSGEWEAHPVVWVPDVLLRAPHVTVIYNEQGGINANRSGAA